VWPLAVAAILIGGLATAAGIWRTTSADAPLAAQAPEEGDQRDRAAPLRPPRAAPPPAPVAELPGTDPADPVARPEPATSGVKARGASRAGALYKSANEARRAGDRARAVRLYRELQRDYPGSPEAKLSRVSLGGLLLDDGAAAQAAEQFDAYASGPGNQRLGAEALYGKGKALMSLGRRVEEIRTWQRLLREYPDSPYTTHARRRLAELR
jgi:TolA-binding protein